MQKPTNLKAGDQFKVIEGDSNFHLGEIITPKGDDGSDCPPFWNADKSDYHSMYFSKLEPYTKTVRDAQVGDVVEDSNAARYLVFERGQSTVLLSRKNDFTKTGDSYIFDQLDRYFTLKDAPEVVSDNVVLSMNEIAEKFGVDVSNLKITKE